MKQTENEARCTGRRLLERVNLQFCTSQTTPGVWSGAADGKPTALCELRTTLRLHQEVFTSLAREPREPVASSALRERQHHNHEAKHPEGLPQAYPMELL